MAMAIVGTTILAFIVKAIVGLRPASDDELQGLDFIDHGEAGYHFDEN